MSQETSTEAIVLAGGEGTRLRPLTNKIPKAMVKIAGRPLLEHVLMWLRKNGIRRVVLGVSYKQDSIIDYFGNGKNLGLRIVYSKHTVPGGTAEGFRKAIMLVNEPYFYAMNGDHITNLRLSDLERPNMGAYARIAITHPRLQYGMVLHRGDICLGFDEKPTLRSVFINMGIYHMSKMILHSLPETGNIETTTFPKLAKLWKLQVYPHEGLFVSVDSIKDIELAEQALQGDIGVHEDSYGVEYYGRKEQ